jgi:hypothetical protein
MLPSRMKASVSPGVVVRTAGTGRVRPIEGVAEHGPVLADGLAGLDAVGDGEALGEGPLAEPIAHAGSPRSSPPSSNCARPREFNLNCSLNGTLTWMVSSPTQEPIQACQWRVCRVS